MNEQSLKSLLQNIKKGKMSVDKGLKQIKDIPFESLGGFAHLDHHRHLRKGFPEIIFAPGKSDVQLKGIVKAMLKKNTPVALSRVTKKQIALIKKISANVKVFPDAKVVLLNYKKPEKKEGLVAVMTGGTSDISVAEEAAVIAEIMGANVKRVFDVGVAGIHRLSKYKDVIQNARVIVAVAGMEGALPSVISGMASCPVIGVPTSVGYGTHFEGVTPLLAMLNSCATGITVVNIDNGLGAGYTAAMINKDRD